MRRGWIRVSGTGERDQIKMTGQYHMGIRRKCTVLKVYVTY